MANQYFRFKQFTVWHDRCAMKVGTDGVLLGAATRIDNSRRILDIGTGTGLVALMLAQRCPSALITAVEIDADAAQQAMENVAHSPWAERIEVIHTDIKQFAAPERFDTIVSNPPYFADSLLPPDKSRTSARHTTDLDYSTLMARVADLLTPDGEFTLIIPTDALGKVESAAMVKNLYFVRRLSIVTKPGASPKRTIATFSFINSPLVEVSLTIADENNNFSDEYRSLARDFYLNI